MLVQSTLPEWHIQKARQWTPPETRTQPATCQTRKLLVYLKTDPKSITLEPGFTRDMTKIGHFGTGDLEVTTGNHSDFERAQQLIVASYQAS